MPTIVKFPATHDIDVRRRRLFDQVLHHGHRHFDQTYWLAHIVDDDEGGRTSEWNVTLHNVAEVDQTQDTPSAFDHCGTVACLAGHGAALMGRTEGTEQPRDDFDYAQHDVAGYFDLETITFQANISTDHPTWDYFAKRRAALHVLGIDTNEHDVRQELEWRTQLQYIGQLLRYEQDHIDRLCDTRIASDTTNTGVASLSQ